MPCCGRRWSFTKLFLILIFLSYRKVLYLTIVDLTLIYKNALKTAEMNGKRAKICYFSHIKQNSIAEIVSTMEYFLVERVVCKLNRD